jgi:phosphoglycolate phosphatase
MYLGTASNEFEVSNGKYLNARRWQIHLVTKGYGMGKYKLVMFDFDGTLADSFEWFIGTINKVAELYDFKPLDLGRLDEIRGYSPRQMMAVTELPWWKLPLVTREMRRLMSTRIDEIPLFQGVNELFQDLRREGTEIAIVTSNAKENVVRVLGSENTALISYWGCGASMFGKQSKVKAVLKASSLLINDAVYVGDAISDSEMAASLKIDFVGVAWGYTKPEILQNHSKIPLLEEMNDLLSVISKD